MSSWVIYNYDVSKIDDHQHIISEADKLKQLDSDNNEYEISSRRVKNV